MMVFGVGYQLLPRLFGDRIHSRALAIVHWWLANGGLALMVAGFILAPHVGVRSAPVTATGGALFSIGAFMFVYNLWRTFNSGETRRRQSEAQTASKRSLTTLDG
jgi:cbb3-type cytochrome oxidase subunit 1